jgi:hypothetical protein
LELDTDVGDRRGTTAVIPFVDPNKRVPAA